MTGCGIATQPVCQSVQHIAMRMNKGKMQKTRMKKAIRKSEKKRKEASNKKRMQRNNNNNNQQQQ